MAPLVSIIIAQLLLDEELVRIAKQNIDSIRENSDRKYELIFIDNNSPKAKDWLEQTPDIYIRNKQNIGNGAAWNQGLEAAHGSCFCLMDNDVIVERGWLSPLLETLQDETIGIAFPYSKSGAQKEFSARLAGYCWMIRRNMYRRFGGLPQDMPEPRAYFEDTAYFKIVSDEGFKLVANPASRVSHLSRATASKVPEITAGWTKNQEWYNEKFNNEYPYLTK